jgi:hypothetical protein
MQTGKTIQGYTIDARGFPLPKEYPYLDIYAALAEKTLESSNLGQLPSQLLWTGDEPIAWDAVAWNAVAWNAVAWNAVAWNSLYWGP